MAASQNQLTEQLKEVGNRLLQPPTSTPELLNLLDEVELLLTKVGQAPSQIVQEALLLPMKSLIADELLRHSEGSVRVTIASCLNEITRISAPVPPYEDIKMKEIFELIVSSFENLSCQPGRCYSKAVLILQSIARLRSCVLMLDLGCDSLITKMFELFQKNISSKHPHSVFLAMEKIMSVMIQESDSVSVELLKVLLASIKNENQNHSPASWELGAKVIEECGEKLKPYIMETVTSMGCCLEDFAPILSSICETEPDSVKIVTPDSSKFPANNEPSAYESRPAESVQCLKAIARCPNATAGSADFKALESGDAASKKERKPNSHNPNDRYENWMDKEKASIRSPRGQLKKNSAVSNSGKKEIPAMEDAGPQKEREEATDLKQIHVTQVTVHGDSSKKKASPRKKDVASKRVSDEAADFEHNQVHQGTPLGDNSINKGRLAKKDVSGGSGNKLLKQRKSFSGGSGSKSSTAHSRKDKIQSNDASRNQRKRASSDDDVFETPHGRKNYKEDLVGCRIKVWWPLDQSYYEGTVTSFNASTKKHKVDYDDGDEEILNLRKECWEFIGDEAPTDIGLFAEKQTSQPPSNMPQQEASREGEKEMTQMHTDGKGVTHNSGTHSVTGSDEAAKEIEKFEIPEAVSETKRPRLFDGQTS